MEGAPPTNSLGGGKPGHPPWQAQREMRRPFRWGMTILSRIRGVTPPLYNPQGGLHCRYPLRQGAAQAPWAWAGGDPQTGQWPPPRHHPRGGAQGTPPAPPRLPPELEGKREDGGREDVGCPQRQHIGTNPHEEAHRGYHHQPPREVTRWVHSRVVVPQSENKGAPSQPPLRQRGWRMDAVPRAQRGAASPERQHRTAAPDPLHGDLPRGRGDPAPAQAACPPPGAPPPGAPRDPQTHAGTRGLPRPAGPVLTRSHRPWT